LKKLFALLSWLLCLPVSQAQELGFSHAGIKAAYMSSVTLPGFKIGVEIPTKVITKNKERSWGTKTILKERYWTFNLGFYHHPNFHNNLYLLAERQFRRQYPKGFFMDFAPGIGYSRTFLNGATYALDANGNDVTKKSLVGYNYIMWSLAGSFGYDFSKTKNQPFKIYLKPSLFVLSPYNSSVYIRPTYEIGIISPLSAIKNRLDERRFL
jgi:hypothetical protein